MSFIDTTGQPTLGLGICARCKRAFPLAELVDDPNVRGLKVCLLDADEFDPWRLPARLPETVTLPFTRPDEPIRVPGSHETTARSYTINGNYFWDIDGRSQIPVVAPPAPEPPLELGEFSDDFSDDFLT